MASRLVSHLITALGQAVGSLTGKTVDVSAVEGAEALPELDDPIIWQQAFSLREGSVPDGPSFWLSAGRNFWETIGRMTFAAAGLDDVTDVDCRSTWLEIINQTMGGIATGLSADLGSEVTPAKGEEIGVEPQDVAWTAFSVTGESLQGWSFKAAWTDGLTVLSEPRLEQALSPAVRTNAASNTFDLLLDVALPVSVSFGRTSLQIREVLKLNTGSIVELDRLVTDPVEVIVNNCVIARGEVVVVDGNYGVRINQLASRDERLRSGMSEVARKTGVRT